MKKNAELTTQQIVGLIILMTSFVVILFFIFRLNLGQTTDKEICHNSVALKAQSKLPTGPLDCKTSYVCISGGGKCEGITPTNTVKVDLNKEDKDGNSLAKNETMKAIADEMADCWWMFGEGKVDYVGFSLESATVGNVNCALCSIIEFDKKIYEDEKLIDGVKYDEFYNYLQSTEKETGKRYLYYLYGTQDIGEVKKIISINPQESIELNKQYSILTGIGKLGLFQSTANWFASGFDAANAFLLITPKFPNYGNMPVTIKEKSEINNLGCTDFLTKA